MKNKNKKIKSEDIHEAKEWLEKNKNTLPDSVYSILYRVVKFSLFVTSKKTTSSSILRRLREEMGILSKGESSGTVTKRDPEDEIADIKKKIKRLKEKSKKLEDEVENCKKRSKRSKKRKKKKFRSESIFDRGSIPVDSIEEQLSVDKQEHFEKKKGLHSVKNERTRYGFKISLQRIKYLVETVTDLKTGKSVTASQDHIGPSNFQITWEALSNLLMLIIGYAIPINRVSKMLSPLTYFTSGRISSLLEYSATLLLPIYTQLCSEISEASIIAGDDTPTKVLELDKLDDEKIEKMEPPKNKLVSQVLEYFGRFFRKKQGKGYLKRTNTSLLTGKTEEDPRSQIIVFRSHRGHLGHFLTDILKLRYPKNKKLIIQSDLSNQNKVDDDVGKKFDITYVGCAAHARRAFAREFVPNKEFHAQILRCFLKLSKIEDSPPEKLAYNRKRHGKVIWNIIFEYCSNVLDGEKVLGHKYQRNSPTAQACKYIVDNINKLTYYLDDPNVEMTNNHRERLLRWEKIMLDSSKFRKTEKGRIVIDVLRSIHHTCVASEVNFEEYLKFVFKNKKDIEDNPELFTPYSFAKGIDS